MESEGSVVFFRCRSFGGACAPFFLRLGLRACRCICIGPLIFYVGVSAPARAHPPPDPVPRRSSSSLVDQPWPGIDCRLSTAPAPANLCSRCAGAVGNLRSIARPWQVG